MSESSEKVASTETLIELLSMAHPVLIKHACITLASQRLKCHDETLRVIGFEAVNTECDLIDPNTKS